MEISRNSWMYKVAYRLSDNKPEVTNLCKFFWRIVSMLFVGLPSFYCLVAFWAVLGFFIACHPTDEEVFKPYKHWPTIKGEKILPVYFVLLFVLYAFLFISYTLAVYDPIGFLLYVMATSVTALAISLLVKLSQSEFANLLKEYLLAKKQKICPIIRFTE